MILGAHRSTAGGRANAFASGQAIGCQAIQIFTASPRQWRASPVTDEEAAVWRETWLESPIEQVIAHDSYLINLAATEETLWAKSRAAFGAELERCQRLGIPYLVTHPGAHVGAGEEAGLRRFAETLRGIYDEQPDLTVTTLLETTAGQGTCLGHRFEHLARLLADLDLGERAAVCLDTCHVLAAGYDLRDESAYAATLAEFDRIIGLERLKVIHANDSRGGLGSRVDRHEQIGEGEIGLAGFRALMRDERLRAVPIIVETPDLQRHEENLRRLRRLARETPPTPAGAAPAPGPGARPG